MAERFVTRRRFRELCGGDGDPIAHSSLTTAVRDGRIIEKKNESNHYVIDLKNAVNKKFLDHYLSKRINAKSQTIVDTEQRKKEVELELKQRELHIKDLTIAKMNAEVIPTELVGILLRTYTKEIMQNLKHAWERITVDSMRKCKASKQDISAMKGTGVKVLNETVTKARAVIDNKIESIVKEYTKAK